MVKVHKVRVKKHSKTFEKKRFIPIVYNKRLRKEHELHFNNKPVVFELYYRRQVVPVAIAWLQSRGAAKNFVVKRGLQL